MRSVSGAEYYEYFMQGAGKCTSGDWCRCGGLLYAGFGFAAAGEGRVPLWRGEMLGYTSRPVDVVERLAGAKRGALEAAWLCFGLVCDRSIFAHF